MKRIRDKESWLVSKDNKKKLLNKKIVFGIVAIVTIISVNFVYPAISAIEFNSCVANIHQHTKDCYENEQLICGSADYVIHTHDKHCYDGENNLICPLPEIKEHLHEESCYSDEKELICKDSLHSHTDECYQDRKILVCPQKEIEVHQHTKSCYKNNQLVCGKLEVLRHQHTDRCINKLKNNDRVENPLNVEEYIEKFELSYKNKDTNKWIQITNETTNVPGDASVLLKIEYHNVEIEHLKSANYRMKYTLPSLLKEPKVSGIITSSGHKIGTIVSDGNSVILEFDKNWIDEQSKKGEHQIKGNFYVESQFDGTQVEVGKPGQIVIGKENIEVHFEEDVHAKHGKVNVEKSKPTFSEEKDGIYLTYKLTVSVPNDAAKVPDVKVVDQFTKNIDYIEEYIGVTGEISETKQIGDISGPWEEFPPTSNRGKVYLGNMVSKEHVIPEPAKGELKKPGIMVWEIGEMQAGETRNLSYRVKLKDNYKGVNAGDSNQAIANTATVFSKTYFRKDVAVNFTPVAKVDISKTVGEYVPNQNDDGGILTYNIWMKADEKNTYRLENVKVSDYFTDKDLLPYIEYVEDSFHLYKGNSTSGDSIKFEDVKPEKVSKNPIINNETTKRFDAYVGSFDKGEEKVLTYSVKIKPGIFFMGNKAIVLRNRATVSSDDRWNDGNKQYNAYSCDKTLDKKVWNRKISKELTTEAITVQIPEKDTVYESLSKKDQSLKSFTVPKNSQKYEVVVNEEGKWDFSNAILTDTLKKNFMKYTGYLKVDAYRTNPSKRFSSDQQTIDFVKQGDLVKTSWLNIHQKSKFSFKPSDLGMDGKYAYVLTYYVSIADTENLHRPVLKNDFQVSGDVVGPNGSTVQIPGITVHSSVIVQGNIHYTIEKNGWYYNKNSLIGKNEWSKGELYWGIQISGNRIPAKMKLKDTIPDTSTQKFYDESMVGIYKGILPKGKKLKDFKSVEELKKAGFQELKGFQSSNQDVTKDDYRWEIRENQYLFIEFNKDIQLNEKNGEVIFTILKSAPQRIPTSKRGWQDYYNKMSSYTSGDDDWHDDGEGKMTVYGSDGIFKEVQGAYTYDGTRWETLKAGPHPNSDKIKKDWITQPGTYVEWLVHINWDGSMSGLAEITDQLPEGLEPVYVRYYWVHKYYRTQNQTVPSTPSISKYENDPDWVKSERVSIPEEETSNRTCISYYNKKSREIRWNVEHLQNGGKIDERAVEFQVVCRVSDSDALLSGKDVTLNNTIVVKSSNGTQTNSDAITIRKNTLNKVGEYNPNQDGNRYPFKIEINPLGEDLVPNVDTITVIDELSPTLILAPHTIKIIDRKTNEDITKNCTIKIEKNGDSQIMRMIVPDQKSLRITYKAYVNAKPGEQIAITNKAYWEGYDVTDGGIVSKPNFSYSAGGSVETDNKPSLKVMKVDKENVLNKLSGAEFSVQKMIAKEDGTLEPVGEKYRKITDENGEAVFSNSAKEKRWMEFNTIYCLKEETAPTGYIKDDKSHYFAIINEEKLENANNKGTYPESVHLEYSSPQYVYTAYNRKGEITIDKKFMAANDEFINNPIDGSYQFGLYDNENGNGKPLQTITIRYNKDSIVYEKDGMVVGTPTFTNLDVLDSKKYYVFELDENQKAVLENQFVTVDGKTFKVSYSKNGIQIGNVPNGKETITITNKNAQFFLPGTGGSGTMWYYIIGISLVCISFIGYSLKKKKYRG